MNRRKNAEFFAVCFEFGSYGVGYPNPVSALIFKSVESEFIQYFRGVGTFFHAQIFHVRRNAGRSEFYHSAIFLSLFLLIFIHKVAFSPIGFTL